MSSPESSDYSQMSMSDLFRIEVENQTGILTRGLLDLEKNPAAADCLESVMRASHSIKGAARILGLQGAAQVAHAMENRFVAAQKNSVALGREQIDALLQAVDFLNHVSRLPENELLAWSDPLPQKTSELLSLMDRMASRTNSDVQDSKPSAEPPSPRRSAAEAGVEPAQGSGSPFLRITPEHWNRLVGATGEALVTSRRLGPLTCGLARINQQHRDIAANLVQLKSELESVTLPDAAVFRWQQLEKQLDQGRQSLTQHLEAFEVVTHQLAMLTHRLHHQAQASRMRPFADGTQAFPRMTRDLARTLNKEVRLEIRGETTLVDREILEKLEAPLTHLLRNAIDHGIEPPEERKQGGKPAEGRATIEARHCAGQLWISVEDDGRGIDWQRLRGTVVQRALASEENAARMSENELVEFLFLPGFTLKENVTEISGRGVGLDVVQSMISSVGGVIRASSRSGHGTQVVLQLPLTRSLVRALVAEIAGEPYAFPLARITNVLDLPVNAIAHAEGKPYFSFQNQSIGLALARQVLELGSAPPEGSHWRVVVLSTPQNMAYGVVVDRFIGETELVVQPLDARLGKIRNISAGAILEDGSPVLLVDVDDWLRSVESLIAAGRLETLAGKAEARIETRSQQILVVDDSLTVRELERKLLEKEGYAVKVAVDGMDGWNSLRAQSFDLVITDIDMPRLDGIELVRLIRQHPQMARLPVMIVSYKDREEDRRRGLDAGADYYLTKGAFQEDALVEAVRDLIGAPTAALAEENR